MWPLRPASGGTPKRGTKILQELHAYAQRDVRLAASQSWSQDHQTTHVVQGVPGAWPEARTNFARYLASGSKYSTMKYAWRVPHNTQCLAVKEVCQAIIDDYILEVMTCPTIPVRWRAISDKFLQKWNFPHTYGALNGKHIACKCPPKSGSQYFNYMAFYFVVLMALVDADYKFIWDGPR